MQEQKSCCGRERAQDKKCEHNHDHGHNHDDGCGCGGDDSSLPSWVFWARLCASAVITAAVAVFLEQSAYGVQLALFSVAWVIATYDIALRMFKSIGKGVIFDENLLMVIASVGALAIGEGVEGLAVVLLFQIGEWLQHRAAERSRRSIADGFALLPEFANLLDSPTQPPRRVGVNRLEISDLIIVRAGERVPADCIVESGGASFDTAALTGESAPRDAACGDEVLAGFIAINGAVVARVLRRSDESAAASVERLLADAQSRKAERETFIRRFAGVYTPIVCAMALVVAILPPLFLGDWILWAHRALTFLVVSCPCALVISVPLSYYAGIGGAARLGVMTRGGAVLESLARRDLAVAFDKTGTLTSGSFAVSQVLPRLGVQEKEVLRLAAAAEQGSAHPIAQAVVSAADGSARAEQIEELAGFGLRAVFEGKELLCGNIRLMRNEGIECDVYDGAGTAVYVAADRQYVGTIIVSDTPKPDARAAIDALKSLGLCDIALLTGDTRQSAQSAAVAAGIDDVRFSLLPDGKLKEIEKLRSAPNGDTSQPRAVLFVGDGINDAPSLVAADIGIAMANGANRLAADAADAVVMNGAPSRVAAVIRLARRTSRTVRLNVTFALCFKLAVLALSAVGYAPMWAAVAADVGVALLCIANALRLLRV